MGEYPGRVLRRGTLNTTHCLTAHHRKNDSEKRLKAEKASLRGYVVFGNSDEKNTLFLIVIQCTNEETGGHRALKQKIIDRKKSEDFKFYLYLYLFVCLFIEGL